MVGVYADIDGHNSVKDHEQVERESASPIHSGCSDSSDNSDNEDLLEEVEKTEQLLYPKSSWKSLFSYFPRRQNLLRKTSSTGSGNESGRKTRRRASSIKRKV